MLLQLRQIKSSELKNLAFSGDFGTLISDETYWLEIKSDNRQVVAEFLGPLQLDERIILHIREPASSSRIHLFSGAAILNLPVSDTVQLGKTDYITLLIKENILITVINEKNTILDAIEDEIISNPFDIKLSSYLLMYFMASEILQNDMEITSAFRKRVNELIAQMEKDRESVSLEEIIHCRTDVSQISNIVEDQYHLLSFTPKLNWGKSEETENVVKEVSHLFLGFDYLQRILQRQEDKLEGLQLQYQSMLQEKGNKRLNILTIVQAIFVPLTLIAGIYGMNFANMPELNWNSGYFMVLGIMGLLILVELWWFKKRGWFD